MPVLDASALETDPEGLDLLKAVLKQGGKRKSRRPADLSDTAKARADAFTPRTLPKPRRPRRPSPPPPGSL
jgi:hypothetical protein